MLPIIDVQNIPLNPRPGYDAMVIQGAPKASGRIVSFSDDGRTARVVWRGTPGKYRFTPDPSVIDVAYIVSGRLAIDQPGKGRIVLSAGSLVEFPREPFDLEIMETFLKVSFLYCAGGLKMKPEPLES